MLMAAPAVFNMDGFTSRCCRTFSGRAGIIFAGSVLGQGIAVLTLPIIARMYDAEILGRAATVLAVVSISALVVCLQYDQAVIVARAADLPYLLILSAGAALAWAILFAALVVLDATGLALGRPHLLSSWGINWILPVLVFIYGIFTLLVNLGLRRNTLVRVSIGRLVYYGGGAVLQMIGSFLLEPRESVFLLAQGLAAFLAVCCLLPYRQIVTWACESFGTRSTLAGVCRVAWTYEKFPKYQMGAGFINAVSIHMPVVFMRAVFSDAWAGWYYMAWRLLASPTTLVSQAVGQVFYRDCAERERAGMEQGPLVETVIAGLVRSSVPAAIALAVAMPAAVDLLLGEAWMPVANVLQVMLIAAKVTFFTSPVSTLLNVKGRQASALRYFCILFGAGLFGLALGWRFQSQMVSVWGYSLARAFILFLFLNHIVISVNGRGRAILNQVLPLIRDSGGVLALVAGLWLTRTLYEPSSLLVTFALLFLVFWRDIRRGGWRVA